MNPYTFGTDQWRAWQKGYAAGSRKQPPRWRSSVTGKFVAKLFGKSNPRESVEEGGQ